ncbi:MAG: hypothetical protein KGN02_13120 [bacterium]|nr:hypothetical protein [bacterium]
MIARWSSSLLFACACTCAAPMAARAESAPCWSLIYDAIEHSASAPHAPYISYAESIRIVQDRTLIARSAANITYRDDGYASVDDDRWARPFLSRFLDPGPPILGPYGHDRRSAWLALLQTEGPYKTIASTQARSNERCVDRGDDVVNGNRVAHLELPDAPTDAPALKEIWIDRTSHDVARIVMSAPLAYYGQDADVPNALVDYRIGITRIGPYQVVHHVTWTYRYRVYDQGSVLDGEYVFTNYQFADTPPEGTLFASREH